MRGAKGTGLVEWLLYAIGWEQNRRGGKREGYLVFVPMRRIPAADIKLSLATLAAMFRGDPGHSDEAIARLFDLGSCPAAARVPTWMSNAARPAP